MKGFREEAFHAFYTFLKNKRDAASRGVPSILVSFYKILRELKLHSLSLF